MKSCPTCKRTFEDTFTFCLADGALLDAPFDPQATLVIPESRQTEPPPPKLFVEKAVEIPPTIASPQPEQKAQELVSTIHAPAPVFESPQMRDSTVRPLRRSYRWLWIIGGILILIIAGVAITTQLRNVPIKRDAEERPAAILRHYNAAYQLDKEGNYAGAEAEYRELLRLEPNDAAWHHFLGLILEKQNKNREAEAEYRETLRLTPDDTLIQDDLKRVLAAQGKSPPK